MSQTPPPDPLQSEEDNESTSSGGSEHPFVRSIRGRYVKVVLYGPTESHKMKIWLNRNSTTTDIKRELLSNGHPQAIVLQAKLGPMPYWSEADPESSVSNTVRILYALAISREQPYLLGVIRTSVSDYPIAILKPGNDPSTTVYQAIIAAQPDLADKISLVAKYEDRMDINDYPLDIKDHQLDFAHRVSLNDRTAFFITTKQSPGPFLKGEPANSIPPFLQIPFVNCEYLLSEDPALKIFCERIAHLLRATLHIIISISRGLSALFDEQYEDLQAALAADEDLSPLLSAAPGLSDELISILESIERIMKDDDHSVMNLGRISDQLDEIFTALCGDFPGAGAVRSSYTDFQNLRKPMPSTIPDRQPQVYSDGAANPSQPTSEINRGEDVDTTAPLETQGSNRNTAGVQSPWSELVSNPVAYEYRSPQSPAVTPVPAMSINDQPKLSGTQLESIIQHLRAQSWYSGETTEEEPPVTAGSYLVEQGFIKDTDMSRFHAFVKEDLDRGIYSCRIPHITEVSAQGGLCTYEAKRLEDVIAHIYKYLNYQPYHCQGISGRHNACGKSFPTIRRREDHYFRIKKAKKVECGTCGEMVLEHNIARHTAEVCPQRIRLENTELAQQSRGISDQVSISIRPTESHEGSSGDENAASSERSAASSERSDEEPIAAPPQEMRNVEVKLLSNTGMLSIPQISIDQETTFEDLRKQLAAVAPPDAILLQAHYGPIPYWTNADPKSQIPNGCRVLYAVNPNRALRYTLVTVRTSLEDYPVAIFDSLHDFPISISNAVLTSLPKVADKVKSILGYPGDRVKEDTIYDYEKLEAGATITFPTVFFVTVSEPPETFLSESNGSVILPLLEPLLEGCKRLIADANQLKNFRISTRHVLDALLHIVISLAEAVRPVIEESDYDGETVFRAQELFRIAPTLGQDIRSLFLQVQAIMEALKGGTLDRDAYSVKIDQIFNALCGEYPGAVNVRQSYRNFRESLRHYQGPGFHELDQPFVSQGAIVPQVVHPSQGLGYEELSSMHAAQVHTKQEGASLLLDMEKAFLELGENSFWLTQNARYSFTDLSPLASSSLEDATSMTMRKCCRVWAKELPLDLLITKSLRAIQLGYDQARSTISEAEELGLSADLNVAVTRICDALAVLDGHVNKNTDPIRVAIVGPMASGKTTFVNSLIGQNLLIPGGDVPILVKHANGLDKPILQINPSQFSDYCQHIVDFMAKANASPWSEEKLILQVTLRQGLLKEREKMNLWLFQGGWRFEKNYEGVEAITEAQQKLHDLVKLCTVLKVDPRQMPSPWDWPVLKVHMTEMSLLSEAFEIIELPAVDRYHDSDFIATIYDNALIDVDGIIAVMTLLDETIYSHSLEYLSYGKAVLGLDTVPLLLAIGTKTDLQMGWNWSKKSEQTLKQMIFHDHRSPRLAPTSPGMYLGAQHAKPFVMSIAKDPSRRRSLKDIQLEDPTTYQALSDLLGLRTWAATYKDETIWQNMPIGEVLDNLEGAIKSSRYVELRGKLDEYVNKAGKRRRLLLGISELGSLVDRFQQTLASVIRKAPGMSAQPLLISHVNAFSDIVREARGEWMASATDTLDTVLSQAVQRIVVDADKKAAFYVATVSDRSFDRLGTRNNITLSTQDDATEFFFEIKTEVTKWLRSLQSGVIYTIRNNARKAWAAALQGLAAKLKIHTEPKFRNLTNDLTRHLTELSVNPIAPQAESTTDTLAQGFNDLGFLIRAPVKRFTPFEPRPFSSVEIPSSYPATLSHEELYKVVADTMLRPWSEELGRECQATVKGALKLAFSSGERCVNEFLTKLESETHQISQETPQTTQNELILLRTNVISSREILWILHRRLYMEIGRPDPLSHVGLPVFLGETDAGID